RTTAKRRVKRCASSACVIPTRKRVRSRIASAENLENSARSSCRSPLRRPTSYFQLIPKTALPNPCKRNPRTIRLTFEALDSMNSKLPRLDDDLEFRTERDKVRSIADELNETEAQLRALTAPPPEVVQN